MTKITVEFDYVKMDTSDFIGDRTEPHEQLQRVYDTYNRVHGSEYTYGPDRTCEEFLTWLTARGVEVSGLYGEGQCWSGWSGNEENMLSSNFGWCLFNAFGTEFLAITSDDGAHVHAPEFYEVTSDDMTNLVDYNRGYVWCNGEPGHKFYTENAGCKWYLDGAIGDEYKMEQAPDPEYPEDFKLRDAWQCPLCPAHITEGSCD